MRTLARPGLLVGLIAWLALAPACRPAADLAVEAETKMLALEESVLRENLTLLHDELRKREAVAAGDPSARPADTAEVILSLHMLIAQKLGRIRRCEQRRAALTGAP